MPRKTEFHGILAVDRTQKGAMNKYRLLALGKGAVVQVDNENRSFVTHASSADTMFNPMTGNMDLEQDEALLTQVEFQSESSEKQVEAEHFVCKSGCGCHIIADDKSLVKFCPNCTASISEDMSDEDDSDDEISDEDFEEDEVQPEIDLEAEDETSESSDEDLDDDSSDEEELEEDSDEDLEGSDEEDESSESIAVCSDSYQTAHALYTQAKLKDKQSSTSGTLEAHYLVCSSSECGSHIIADDQIEKCPICSAELAEPEDGEIPITQPEAEDAKVEEKEPELEAAPEETPEETEVAESGDDSSLSVIPEASEEEPKAEESEEEVLDAESTEISTDTVIDKDAKAEDLDVSYSSSVAGSAKWTAYFKGIPVAMASKSSAGKNADIFDTPAFGRAALATAKVSGVKKALAELGFNPIKHQVSISQEVSRMVADQIAAERVALASEQKQFQDEFMASLATAAIGINRGFFADVENPLKHALWNSMSSAGIKNPEVLIDKAFKDHSDAYHKVLFEQATDIASKPVEVQESLAKTILGTTYQSASSSYEENLGDRIAGMGVSTSSNKITEQKSAQAADQSPSDMQKIHSAVASLGRRRI